MWLYYKWDYRGEWSRSRVGGEPIYYLYTPTFHYTEVCGV
jgi:hypothetical protein